MAKACFPIAIAASCRLIEAARYCAAIKLPVPIAKRRGNLKGRSVGATTRVASIAGGALVAALLASGAAGASVIVITSNPTTSASTATCTNTVLNFTNCTSQAFTSFNDATMTTNFLVGAFNGQAPTTQTFQTAFNTWTGGPGPAGVAWNIVNGGVLNNVTLTIDPFTAAAGNKVGGIGPNSPTTGIGVSITLGAGYAGPPLGQLVWTQALYTNDSPTNPFGAPYIVPPANTLDTYTFSGGGDGGTGAFAVPCTKLPAPPANSNKVTVSIGATPAGTSYCDPIYPFQQAGKQFYDAPQLGWPSASFRAIDLLSTVSETTNAADMVTAATLTVYDGIEYGFDLTAAPAPAIGATPKSFTLLLGGLLMLWAMRRSTRVTFTGSTRC
jgi:hypothetical protein